MKKLLFSLLFLFLVVACNGQPNTTTTIQIGIVNMQPDKDYLVFAELKDDTNSPRLIDGMDYLSPNVLDLKLDLVNSYVIADTTFWDYEYPDKIIPQYAMGGIVQVNLVTLKYSAMTISDWVEIDTIEANTAGFIYRRKIE